MYIGKSATLKLKAAHQHTGCAKREPEPMWRVTGERTSAAMLLNISAQYIIIVASERRTYTTRSDELIAKKRFAWCERAGLTPVLAKIGEPEAETKSRPTEVA